MKISNRTHPILEKISNCKLGVLPVYEDDKTFFENNVESYKYIFEKLSKLCKNNINSISSNFEEAMFRAKIPLAKLYKDDMDKNISFEIAGVYIYNEYVSVNFQKVFEGSDDIEVAHMLFFKDAMPLGFWVYNTIEKQEVIWLSQYLKANKSEIKTMYGSYTCKDIMIEYFKKYAKVETKFLPANKTVKEINCKYVNDTNANITILDSTWFTNLVKSDAFKVRGHFRLQPCGEGLKEKKLIWISDFEKNGYVRNAKKLTEYPTI